MGGWWGDKKWVLAREEGGRKFQGCQVAPSLSYNNEKVNFQNFEEVTYHGTFGTQLYVVLSNI